MGAYTPRAGLYKPGGGSTGLILPDEPVDIDKLNSNFDIIDSKLGARNIPSASSYSGEMDGDIIYAQDTGYLQMYSGNESRLITPRLPGATVFTGTVTERDALTEAGGVRVGDRWRMVGQSDHYKNLEYIRTADSWIPSASALFYTAQGIGRATSTAYSYMTWDKDTAVTNDDRFKSTPNTNGIRPPVDGIYFVSVNLRQNGTSASTIQLWLNNELVLDRGFSSSMPGASGAAASPHVSGLLECKGVTELGFKVVSATTGANWNQDSRLSMFLVQAY